MRQNSKAKSSSVWQHDDVFPIIAEIIQKLGQQIREYVTVEEIGPLLMAHRATQRTIAQAADELGETPEEVASNMVAWFSQRISAGTSDWAGSFDRRRVGPRWGYRPKVKQGGL